jgi:hypothetical protein
MCFMVGKGKHIKFELCLMLSFLFYHVFCLSWEDVINLNHVLSTRINIFQFKKNIKKIICWNNSLKY